MIQELKMQELKDLFFYTLGIVPLQNYNVVGDGITDNRLNLQQAIYDAIEVGAKYIFVPKGNYYYSQELFRADEVAWLGNSIDAYIRGVEIKQFPSFDNVIYVKDEYSESNQDTYSINYINKEINKKVDKVEGKDLSTNDFTNEYKQKLDNSINAENEYSESTKNTYSSDYINKKLDGKVEKVEGKDLSSNDFTDEYKQKLDNIEFTNNFITYKYYINITAAVSAGGIVTLPCYYKVGQSVLDVFLNGERLLLSSDDAGTDGHYREVGDVNSISNQIKITEDWSLDVGDYLDLVVRGEYSV